MGVEIVKIEAAAAHLAQYVGCVGWASLVYTKVYSEVYLRQDTLLGVL